MTANELLKSSLNTLATKLGEFPDEHSSEFQPISKVLNEITERGMETDAFRKNLKELAEAVIQVRKSSPSRFRELPVPPYDLWLPFKAEDLTPTDSVDLEEAKQIFNHKVTELALSVKQSPHAEEKEPSEEQTQSQGSASDGKE
ncbi:MAG: hypothetical protein WCB68_09905 [Pyrinomonadaceae bacterium]